MNLSNRHTSVVRVAWVGVAVAVVMLITQFDFGVKLSSARSAPPSNKRSEHVSDGDHARKEASLRKVMNGPVDIYFDVTEVETEQPLLAGVRFVDLVDVTGKELMRFESETKERWLIDPDMVLTFRIPQNKLKTHKKR